MPSKLKKLLKAQLGGHIGAHIGGGELHHARIVDSVRTPGKKISKVSNVFLVVEKLPVYVGSCRAMARERFQDLNRAGMILLVKSPSGVLFHVEVEGTAKEPKVSRVSSGAIATDLEKSIRNVGKRHTSGSRDQELRLLRVASLHMSAVWVHYPKKHATDLFVPYTPNFAGLRLGRIYKLHRFELLLKNHATQMILRWYDRYEKRLAERKE